MLTLAAIPFWARLGRYFKIRFRRQL